MPRTQGSSRWWGPGVASSAISSSCYPHLLLLVARQCHECRPSLGHVACESSAVFTALEALDVPLRLVADVQDCVGKVSNVDFLSGQDQDRLPLDRDVGLRINPADGVETVEGKQLDRVVVWSLAPAGWDGRINDKVTVDSRLVPLVGDHYLGARRLPLLSQPWAHQPDAGEPATDVGSSSWIPQPPFPGRQCWHHVPDGFRSSGMSILSTLQHIEHSPHSRPVSFWPSSINRVTSWSCVLSFRLMPRSLLLPPLRQVCFPRRPRLRADDGIVEEHPVDERDPTLVLAQDLPE